ncbi:hypothetical protein VSDG_03502 [Cytospora chrysosperma]|uniref:Uncharacterized protein n=1 Tax=Cytospora chrysosperma TaxID=252740 RepID=A0A423W9Y4_CYTCH|nr:hypothetical protein VSDG_03502 [Valsa sordida]
MDPFVSKEWTAQPTYNRDIGWDRRPRPKPPTRHPGRNGDTHQGRKGPSSLTEMAARVAAANVHNFDPLYLRDLSPTALQAILKQLTRLPETISLSAWKGAWKIIQELKDPQAPMALALQRFHQHFQETTAPLSAYLKPLQSDSFAFISHLKIAGACQADSTELMQLPALVKNLGVLEIREPDDNSLPFPRLSDRLVRGWSLHEDPFPWLRVLKIYTHDALTLECLQYVTRFPALAMFELHIAAIDLYSSKIRAKGLAKDYGWIYARWSDPYGSGSAYPPAGASIGDRQSWLGLARRIGSKSRASTADTYLDAGAQGYEAYAQLEQPVLTALRREGLVAPSPFVSLTLGRDSKAIGLLSPGPEVPGTMFFWRYWDHGGPDGPTPRFAPAANAVIRPTPALGKPTTEVKPGEEEETGRRDKRRALSRPGGPIMRPRKKLRGGSVGEALSQFQGS